MRPRCIVVAPMAATKPLMDWSPTSWQNRQAAQQPLYRDPARLQAAVAELSRLPPLVTSWEIEELKSRLAQAQRGEAFLLQGGDCAESFEECQSEIIVQKLKILLQMSLVLTAGLKKPVIRVGRMAGQYAKAAQRQRGSARRGSRCRASAGTWSIAAPSSRKTGSRTRRSCCGDTSGRHSP